MPAATLARSVLLPELELTYCHGVRSATHLHCERRSDFEVCPRCATKSHSVYDHREVRVKDAPLRGKGVVLKIRKRRLFCKPCRKPFTEYIPGIPKGQRTTERYRRALCWAADNFSDLEKVRKAFRCSRWLIYKSTYEQLELKRRSRLSYPWPRVIGIDEHAFRRNQMYGGAEFVSMVVDYPNRRVFEVVNGRSSPELKAGLMHIAGRENVKWVNMDMSSTYRSFARDFFPNAEVVADKFHVLRLLNPALNRRRKEITGDKRTNPIRRLLLCSGKCLSFFQRGAVYKWLEAYPELCELYHAKEALMGFYRIKGYERARRALSSMCDRLATSQLPELKTLRKTLISWRREILNYFRTGLTNARVEGFNNKAMIVRTRAYGYRSFKNYRLRVLNA